MLDDFTVTLIPHRCKPKKSMGHRPSQKEDGAFKDSNQPKHFTESYSLLLQSWTKVLGQYPRTTNTAPPTPSPHPTDSVETVKAQFL